jgi:hypothetical protein
MMATLAAWVSHISGPFHLLNDLAASGKRRGVRHSNKVEGGVSGGVGI